MAEIESPKAVSVIYAPIDLTIIKNNLDLEDDYSQINKEAEKTWLFKAVVKNEKEIENMMKEEDYKKYLETLD